MEKSQRRRIRATMWIGLAAAGFWLWFNWTQQIRVAPAESAPAASPLRMRDLDHRAIDLAEYRGRVVVLTLWASWCPPCRTEAPRLVRLARDYRDQGLVVLGLNDEGLSDADLAAVGREWGVTYPLVVPLVDLRGTSFEGEGAVPHVWMIDRRGRVRASKAGLVSERSLRRAAERLLEEPSDAGASSAPAAVAGQSELAQRTRVE